MPAFFNMHNTGTEIIVDFSSEADKRRLWAVLRKAAGTMRINLTQYRVRRSSQANRYYWGVIVRAFREFMADQGQPFSAEQCHEHLAGMFLKVPIINPKTGELMGNVTRSTADLNTHEFAAYLESCIAWLADTFDIVVPSPGEYGVKLDRAAGKTA